MERSTWIAIGVVGALGGCGLFAGGLAVGAFFLTSMKPPPSVAPSATPTMAPSAPAGFTTHRDPAGFSVSVPAGWRVIHDAATGVTTIAGPDDARAVAMPFFIPGVALSVPVRGALSSKLASKLIAAEWEKLAVGDPTTELHGHAGRAPVRALITWTPTSSGTAGRALAATAPDDARFAELEETFATVLASFTEAGAPLEPKPADATNALRFVRFTDPRERAFTCDVPVSWKTEGGLFRFASVDVRRAVRSSAPDENAAIVNGDAEVPSFIELTPILETTGFREGMWYSPGQNVNLMVRRYVTGQDFATEYVQTKFARTLRELAIKDTRERADAVAMIDRVYSEYSAAGIQAKITAGEVAFTAKTQAGRDVLGYFFVATTRAEAPGGAGAIWGVEMLHGWLAAPASASVARAALDRMLGTFELAPEWVRMQQNITMETSRIVAKTHAEISKLIADSYWTRQRTQDELSRRRSNATLGVEDVVDPETGRAMKVESGGDYYWIDHRGNVVGTETSTRPSIDFRELLRRP